MQKYQFADGSGYRFRFRVPARCPMTGRKPTDSPSSGSSASVGCGVEPWDDGWFWWSGSACYRLNDRLPGLG